MKKAVAYFLLVFTFFSGGCSREKSEYTFKEMQAVEVDESKVVLTRFPNELKEINDSTIGTMNSGTHLSLYNIYTGVNIANFSTQFISFDSLITSTYRKKYLNKREYKYDVKMTAGMAGGNSQLLNFYYAENNFYVYVNTLVDVNYVNDPKELEHFLKNANANQINPSDVNIQIMEYLEFLFVLDNELNIKNIIPLYEREKIKTHNYSPFFQKGFAIKNSTLFVPIYNNEKGVADMSAKLVYNNDLSCLAKYDLTNDSTADFALTFKTIDFNDFSIRNYFTSTFKFRNVDGELFFSNGKEILNVDSEKRILSKDRLEKNEWISDFQKHKNTITLITYKLFKKQHLSETEKAYGADSLGDLQIKVFNDDLVATKKLSQTTPSFLVTENKIVFIEKNKEHYYIKSIGYHEN